MNSPAVTFEVASRFQNLRRKYVALRILSCIALSFAIGLSCWLLLALGDYLWEWPTSIRRVLAVIAGIGAGLHFVVQLLQLYATSGAGRFASQLEQQFDSLGQRLRTVLEAVEGKLRAPEPMLSALGHQTLGRWETASPTNVLPYRAATIALVSVLALVCIALIGMVAGNDWQIAMLRAIGSERAYTEMEVSPGTTRLLEGTALKVELKLRGRIDRKVTLLYRTENEDSWTESELLPRKPKERSHEANFEASLGKLQHPIEYQFVTSAGTTPLYRVDVQPFIQVEKFETLVTPPTYTRLEARTFSQKELTVLSGSRVEYAIGTNHPLSEAELLIGEKLSALEAVPLQKNGDPKVWKFELPSKTSVHWQFSGKGSDGTPITPLKGRLRIRYDEEPRVEWRDPSEEIKVHMLAELPMRAQVSDDYGLTESGIVFQVGDEEEYVLKNWVQTEVEGATPDSVTTQLKLEELLPLESLLLSERDFITYYAYAVDNREGSPHRIETDTRYIDIQPLRQFWAEQELDPNAAGAGGGVVPQLEEIIRRQRFLINRTRRESNAQSVNGPTVDATEQLPKIERMVASQSELADLTRFLMDFFVSIGNDDTEALSQAEAAMLQAVDSLTKADFSSALVQEEEAGRALAEARNSIENVLAKNLASQQMSQIRAFVQQMRQKLRRASPKTDKQLADSLEQIANEQKRLANELERQASSGTNQDSNVAGEADAKTGGTPNTTETAQTEASGKTESEEANSSSEESKGVEEIKPETREQELVERLRAIDTGLSQSIKRSSLVGKRMESSTKAMDDLTGRLRELSMSTSSDPNESNSASSTLAAERMASAATAREISDQLRELAMHIDGLSQSEPANRISTLRDMTVTLSNMEREVSHAMAVAGQSRKPVEEAVNTNGESEQVGSPDQQPIDAQHSQAMKTTERIGRRLGERASTIEDVLKIAPDLGSLEANEINDRIQKFVAENELLEELASSRTAMEQSMEVKQTEDWSHAANSRSAEYAEIATLLDGMYRQLVTPRTDQLRKLETVANQLSKALSQQASGGKSNETQPKGKGSGVESLKRELENGLKEAELDELAELLDGEGTEFQQQPSASENDPVFQESGSDAVPGKQFSLDTNPLVSGVARVQKELRSRIQELIMLEIASDRDVPIPSQYRELIDGYFRTIAGGESVTPENLQ